MLVLFNNCLSSQYIHYTPIKTGSCLFTVYKHDAVLPIRQSHQQVWFFHLQANAWCPSDSWWILIQDYSFLSSDTVFDFLCRCANGYYGDPLIAGQSCIPCDCNGNINPKVDGYCNSLTGECLKCIGNSVGHHCERCADGYYGDAVTNKDCHGEFFFCSINPLRTCVYIKHFFKVLS